VIKKSKSSGDIFRMQCISELGAGEVAFFNGSDPLASRAFVAGAAGRCTAAACLIPSQCLQPFDAVQSGDLESPRRALRPMLPLLDFILRGDLPPTVKQGREGTWLRRTHATSTGASAERGRFGLVERIVYRLWSGCRHALAWIELM
jgi:dihydrodipicolinate synthase/N-acetylneuraminate lyase